MPAPFRSLLYLVALIGSVLGGEDPDRAAFEKGLATARRAADRGEWRACLSQLDRLLIDHAEQDYVRARRIEIEDLHRRASFRAATPTPHARSLVGGEWLAGDVRTGRIKLRYTEFVSDFTRDGERVRHDARLRWPVHVTLQCRLRPDMPASIVVGDEESPFVWALTGPDAQPTTPLPIGPRVTLSLKVDDGAITLTVDKRRTLRVTTPRSDGGHVGFAGLDVEELVVDGRAEPSWLQGLVDDALHAAFVEFERDYRARERLPAWLFVPMRPDAGVVGGADRDDGAPDELDDAQSLAVVHVDDLMRRNAPRTAIAFLDGMGEDQLPRATELTLRIPPLLRLGRHRDAEAHAEELVQLAPESLLVKKLRADVAVARGRREEAASLWRDLVTQQPGRADYYVDAATALLAFGRVDDAKEWFDEARSRGVASGDLDVVERMLVQAQRGPDWPRVHTHHTPHFVVASDIDLPTCEQAGRVLEESLALYREVLGPTGPLPRKPFRVYLFSGKEGYQRYASGLWGRSMPAHTAGVYSPILKQTLIRNQPRRDDMFAIVRHEAFHHYLDHRMRHPPIWLDEGFAEYFMGARRGANGKLVGDPRPDHTARLKRDGLIPLAQFVELDFDGFFVDGERHYAQAFAFCHFLRHGGDAARAAFDRLWALLVAGASAPEAIAEVFDPATLATLQPLFEAHVAGM